MSKREIDCAVPGGRVCAMGDSAKVQRNLRAAMKEAPRIQDRFVAEPVFGKTARGFLKSEGVGTMQKSKPICVEKLPRREHDQSMA